MRSTGHYERLGNLQFFIPDSLPPKEPAIEITGELAVLYGEAMLRLGQLSEMGERLPDLQRFIKAYVIKEALLTSEIEGIHTTLQDVLSQPLVTSKPKKETQLVVNYTASLEIAMELIQKQDLPIVSRVLLAAHAALMDVGAGGDQASPGKYRQQSVQVGEHVPPPAPDVLELMADLEKFINTDESLPPLIQAGLAHVQFETIHPFLDGNGRIGRLLIVLMLIKSGLLPAPILYPSYYFKKHHAEYYLRLDAVRKEGDFEGWLGFYLKAIRDGACDAHQRAREIEALEKTIRESIQNGPEFHKIRETAQQALSFLFQFPILGVKDLSEHLKKSYNTAHNLISKFETVHLLQEVSEQKRSKLYRFSPYLDLLERE